MSGFKSLEENIFFTVPNVHSHFLVSTKNMGSEYCKVEHFVRSVTLGQGWAPHSFRSFKERNVLFRSFATNVKECKERNVLLQRT